MGRVSVGGQVPATLDRIHLLGFRARWTCGSVVGERVRVEEEVWGE